MSLHTPCTSVGVESIRRTEGEYNYSQRGSSRIWETRAPGKAEFTAWEMADSRHGSIRTVAATGETPCEGKIRVKIAIKMAMVARRTKTITKAIMEAANTDMGYTPQYRVSRISAHLRFREIKLKTTIATSLLKQAMCHNSVNYWLIHIKKDKK